MKDLQWALELTSHWQWVYLVVGIICLAVLVEAKRSWWPLIPSLVLGASFFVQSATLDRSTEPVGSKPVLQVATANLNFDTTDFSALVGWLASGNAPDVVFLQEFTGWHSKPSKRPRLPSATRIEARQWFGGELAQRFWLVVGFTARPRSGIQRVAACGLWPRARFGL